MKHFNNTLFNEIITGMQETCKGVQLQQLLKAATEIYLASDQDETKEGEWQIERVERTIRIYKIAICPFCGKESVLFVADTLDYCSGCGAKLVIK